MSTIISLSDLANAILAARSAQQSWAAAAVRRRLQVVRAFRLLLVRDCKKLDAAIVEEIGKAPGEAIGTEILATADACRFLERRAERLLRQTRVSSSDRPLWMFGQRDTVHRRPRGLVAIIGTWNYPLFLNAGQIIQALTAGNAVIWKPSEVTPRFADLLHGLIHEALGSEDQALFQRLPATRDAGPALVEADIDHLVFTGSANVGSKLAARLGERLISSTLELSGCDMQLILADADVDLAAKAAWFGSTLNRGQTCIAVRRSLVHRSLYPGFCEKLRGFVEGAGECRLILPSQVAQLQRLLHQAQQAGAKIVGSPPTAEGTACRPVVVLDARPEMAVCRDASFAPVLAVLPFDTVEDALQIEQKCGYALGSSIFTRDINQAETLAARLRPGLVAINDAVVPSAHPATPFGGRGQSGWGVTQGAEGLLEMTIPQVVSVKSGNFRPHYEGAIDPSKTVAQAELLAALLEASHGRTIWQRLSGWWRTIQAGRKL